MQHYKREYKWKAFYRISLFIFLIASIILGIFVVSEFLQENKLYKTFYTIVPLILLSIVASIYSIKAKIYLNNESVCLIGFTKKTIFFKDIIKISLYDGKAVIETSKRKIEITKEYAGKDEVIQFIVNKINSEVPNVKVAGDDEDIDKYFHNLIV